MGPRKRAQRRDSRLVRARARPHGLPLETAAILAVRAAVAQLARASACHAEGRGFESLQPLRSNPLVERVRASVCLSRPAVAEQFSGRVRFGSGYLASGVDREALLDAAPEHA